MPGPHLVYFADPMCSWCWGFSTVVEAVRGRFGPDLPIWLILGGLRPNTVEPLTEAAKREIREHWEHVQEASGRPFDWTFFDREGFVYDTEPASRAVVAARRAGTDAALDFLTRAHAAFYAHNHDVTDEEVLADLGAEAGHNRATFLESLRSEEVRQETWSDFAIAQRAGIRGFPCLLAAVGGRSDYGLVTNGFQSAERILPALERWLAAARSPGETAAGRAG